MKMTTSKLEKMLSNSCKKLLINCIRKIKRQISQTPKGARIADKLQKIIFRYLFKKREDLFTYYYTTNKWGNNESFSGPGSSLAATLNIRTQIPKIIQEYKVLKLLDAPCGDFYWFRMMTIPPDIEYIGGDIVKKAIELNTQKYGKSNFRFIHMDILIDDLPVVDLWLCRDALFHFSNSDILRVFLNLKKSRIKYLLTTTFPETHINEDITTGDYRLINLEKSPFNLPPPLRYVDDSDAGPSGKKLGLWRLN